MALKETRIIYKFYASKLNSVYNGTATLYCELYTTTTTTEKWVLYTIIDQQNVINFFRVLFCDLSNKFLLIILMYLIF